jgi:hypothetical protein
MARNSMGMADFKILAYLVPSVSQVDWVPIHIVSGQSFSVACAVARLPAGDPRRTPVVIERTLSRTGERWFNIASKVEAIDGKYYYARVMAIKTDATSHKSTHMTRPMPDGTSICKHYVQLTDDAEARAAVDADLLTVTVPDVVFMLAVHATEGVGGLQEQAKAAAEWVPPEVGVLHPFPATIKYLGRLNFELPVYKALLDAMVSASDHENGRQAAEEEQAVSEKKQQAEVGVEQQVAAGGGNGDDDDEEEFDQDFIQFFSFWDPKNLYSKSNRPKILILF